MTRPRYASAASAVLITLALLASQRHDIKVEVCLVASGPEGQDMTTSLWEDEVEKYFERYPGSYRGKCQ